MIYTYNKLLFDFIFDFSYTNINVVNLNGNQIVLRKYDMTPKHIILYNFTLKD